MLIMVDADTISIKVQNGGVKYQERRKIMSIKKAKRVIVSLLLVSILGIFSVIVASAGTIALITSDVSYPGGGTIDWSYYSAGDYTTNKVHTHYWRYVTGFSSVTIVSKRSAFSSMDPNKLTYGYITANYAGQRVYSDRQIVGHYFDTNRRTMVRV